MERWLTSLHSQNLPEDWRCPTCGAEKSLFVLKATKVAGFSQNQGAHTRVCVSWSLAEQLAGYGLGSNGMTGEQKSLLIYGALPCSGFDLGPLTRSPAGTLTFFFAMFIAGYLLD